VDGEHMRTELEPHDIEAVAQRVMELLAPALKGAQKAQVNEELLTPEDLAALLHVDLSWIYKQTQTKTLPHKKLGKYIRFSRSEVMRHLEKSTVPAASPAKIPKGHS